MLWNLRNLKKLRPFLPTLCILLWGPGQARGVGAVVRVQDWAQHTLDVSGRTLWDLFFGSPAFPLQEVYLWQIVAFSVCVCVHMHCWRSVALSLCNNTDSLAAHLQPAVGVLCLGADVDTRAPSFPAWSVLHGIPPSFWGTAVCLLKALYLRISSGKLFCTYYSIFLVICGVGKWKVMYSL